MENINNIDEAKLLGYFETIKSVFLMKVIFQDSFTKEEHGHRCFDAMKLSKDSITSVKELYNEQLFYTALTKGNEEIYLNFVEDTVTSLITSSWNVFEQITKDLTKTDYATRAEDQSVCYQNRIFQLEKQEKKDIELFYYIRNAIHHYNGAYYANKDINHRYANTDFKSIGHHGEKIALTPPIAWRIACDLEKYTIKAWTNANPSRKKHS